MKTYGTGSGDFCKERNRSLKSKWRCKKKLENTNISLSYFFHKNAESTNEILIREA